MAIQDKYNLQRHNCVCFVLVITTVPGAYPSLWFVYLVRLLFFHTKEKKPDFSFAGSCHSGIGSWLGMGDLTSPILLSVVQRYQQGGRE